MKQPLSALTLQYPSVTENVPACARIREGRNAVYSHDGPIRRKPHRYILTMDQSDAIRAGIFSRWTNQTRGRPHSCKKRVGGALFVASHGDTNYANA
eukprot:919169-Pyramimonas_sp.AAC.1